MKKSGIILLTATATVAAIAATTATDRLWFNAGNISMGLDADKLDNIAIVDDSIKVTLADGASKSIARTALTNVTAAAGDETTEVLITYDGDRATIVNPYAFEGLTITTDGADVTVNNTVEQKFTYRLTGTTTTGSFKVYSVYQQEIVLDNVSLTNDNGSAINVQGKKASISVKKGTESTLCDSKKYNTPEGEDEKGTIFSEGNLEFSGKGTLNITANNKHAIVSDNHVEIKNITINIVSASSDGIHANDYVSIGTDGANDACAITMTNIGGDAVDCDDAGYFTMSGGKLTATVSGDANKGIKASGGAVTISGGSIDLTMSGNSTIKKNEPSYCSGIKCGTDFNMTGGDITIRSTGTAGKGISIDGNGKVTAGTIDIEVAGAGGTYTTTSSTTDSYSATCITADGNLDLIGGTYTLNTTSAASGGKCIKVDGVLTIGDETAGPTITATTRGSQFQVSGSSSGSSNGGRPGGFGWGGNWGGGGGANADYCNPKVVKAIGNLIVNNGTLKLNATTSTEGGEGLESKATLTINGGDIEIKSADDCINAATDIVINGGNIYCYSTGNDAIDSNGKIHMNGGKVIAFGAASPECGIDCDNNSNFTLTGGYIVSLAGSNNTPSGSGTSQRVAVTTGSVSTSTVLTFTDESGNFLFSFKSPINYSNNPNLMISCPYMKSTGLKIKEYTGASVSGGETFNGLTTGATYTGGTLKTTLTTR
jgi:hypothetical protein